jgi:hypothetical protein
MKKGWKTGCQVGCLSALGLAVLLFGGCILVGRYGEVSTHLAKIKPGMTYAEVARRIPRSMARDGKQPCTSLTSGIYLVSSNALVASELRCTELFFPLNSATYAVVYFDRQDKVVGLYYSSSGGRWKPKWGVMVDVYCADRDKNIDKAEQQGGGYSPPAARSSKPTP